MFTFLSTVRAPETPRASLTAEKRLGIVLKAYRMKVAALSSVVTALPLTPNTNKEGNGRLFSKYFTKKFCLREKKKNMLEV